MELLGEFDPDAELDVSGYVLPVTLEGTVRLDVGTVPAVWVQLPAELSEERGRFDVEIRFGDRTDVAGVKFDRGTCWIVLPSSVVREAAAAGKLAVFTEPGAVENAPYFTIDWPDR